MIEGNRFVDCNIAAVKTLGYPNREALLNLHPSQISPVTQADGELSFAKAERIMAIVRQQGFHCFEWLHQRADGSNFVAEVTLSSVLFQGRQVIICIGTDLSARRDTARQLGELLQEQRLIFDHAPVGILMMRKRRILKCNQQIASMFGFSAPADLEGRTTEMFYGSEARFAALKVVPSVVV